jgi:hypothetical protein
MGFILNDASHFESAARRMPGLLKANARGFGQHGTATRTEAVGRTVGEAVQIQEPDFWDIRGGAAGFH